MSNLLNGPPSHPLKHFEADQDWKVSSAQLEGLKCSSFSVANGSDVEMIQNYTCLCLRLDNTAGGVHQHRGCVQKGLCPL